MGWGGRSENGEINSRLGQTRTQSLFMCFGGARRVGVRLRRARSLMGRDEVTLLSPPKHINSDWVRVCPWVRSVYPFGRIKTMAKPQGAEEKENLIVSLEHVDDIIVVDKSINHGKLLSIYETPSYSFALSFSCWFLFFSAFLLICLSPESSRGREV